MYKNLNRSLEVGIYKLSMTFSESIKRIAYNKSNTQKRIWVRSYSINKQKQEHQRNSSWIIF